MPRKRPLSFGAGYESIAVVSATYKKPLAKPPIIFGNVSQFRLGFKNRDDLKPNIITCAVRRYQFTLYRALT